MRYTRDRRSWGAHCDLCGCLILSRSYGLHLWQKYTSRIFMRGMQIDVSLRSSSIGSNFLHTHVLFILACPSFWFGFVTPVHP